MTPCEYAACDRPGRYAADGWQFCREHLRHHEAIRDDLPLPRSAPAFPRSLFAPPCGTSAGARRHQRRGEPTCDACRNAATRRKHGYTSTAALKKWHGVAS